MTLLTDVLSWSGSIALSICAIPAAYSAWKEKKCQYNKYFIWLWFWGEVLLLGYTILTKQWPLLPNYIVNILAISIIWRYNHDTRNR